MASSKEAFAKFAMWKNSGTALKLTAIVQDEAPEILRGRISSLDEKSLLLSFAVTATRSFKTIEIRDSSFRVGMRAVEVKREEDLLMFEAEVRREA